MNAEGAPSAGEILLAFREDFTIWENQLEEGGAIAGSIESDKYIMIPAADRAPIVEAVTALRKGRSPQEIGRGLREKGWDLDVNQLVELLYHKTLVSKNGRYFRPRRSDIPGIRPNDEINAFSKTLLCIRVRRPLLRPEQVKHIFGGLLIAICVVALADSVLLFVSSPARELLHGILLRASRWGGANWGANTLGVGLVALLSFAVHEAGHVLMARRHGLYLRSIQFRFYRIFQSYLAVQIPGLCTLPLRAQVEVALAGPLANLLLGLFLILTGTVLPYSPSVTLVLLIGAGINIFAGISNMNPFFPTDGYRFLSVVLFRNPDIRSHVVALMRSKGFRGLRVPEKIYVGSYAVSTIALLALSNWFLLLFAKRLLGRIVPIWLAAVLAGAAALVVDYSFLRRTVRFFKGRT